MKRNLKIITKEIKEKIKQSQKKLNIILEHFDFKNEQIIEGAYYQNLIDDLSNTLEQINKYHKLRSLDIVFLKRYKIIKKNKKIFEIQ